MTSALPAKEASLVVEIEEGELNDLQMWNKWEIWFSNVVNYIYIYIYVYACVCVFDSVLQIIP